MLVPRVVLEPLPTSLCALCQGNPAAPGGSLPEGIPRTSTGPFPIHTACGARAAAVVLLGTEQGSWSGARSRSLAPCALGRLLPLFPLLYGASPSQELCCPFSKE